MASWECSTVVACMANWLMAMIPDVWPRATSSPAPVVCALRSSGAGAVGLSALPCCKSLPAQAVHQGAAAQVEDVRGAADPEHAHRSAHWRCVRGLKSSTEAP